MTNANKPRPHPPAAPLWLAAILGLSLGAPAALAGPQSFNSALPVAKGEFVFRQQFLRKKASDDPTAAARDLSVNGAVSVLAYGLSSKLAVFGVIPYLDKSLDITTPGGRITRRTSGIADARLFLRYQVFQRNARGKSLRIAPYLGVKLPTGSNSARDSAGLLPAPLQLGSGSWDPFVGVIATYQTINYELDFSASYKANHAADGFEFGDESRLDASLQYRLWPRDLGAGTPGFLYGVLEGNLVHQAKNRAAGVEDPNSGGTSLFLSPGLQYVTRRWVAEAIVQIPVAQNLNGTALRDDYTLRAGFRFNF